MIDLAAKPVLDLLPGSGRDLPSAGKELWEQRGAGLWGHTDLSRGGSTITGAGASMVGAV